jgi:hypothetical protein
MIVYSTCKYNYLTLWQRINLEVSRFLEDQHINEYCCLSILLQLELEFVFSCLLSTTQQHQDLNEIPF